MTGLGSLGAGGTYARAINEGGQITGDSRTPEDGSDTTRAFLWEAGLMQDLGTFFGDYWLVPSYGQAINDSGQVAGTTIEENFDDRAFRWSVGSMQNLGTLDGQHASRARAINNAGHVVGYSGGYRAFAWDGTSMRDLGTLSGQTSIAHGINDDGMIVGAAEVAPGPWWHAAIFDGSSNVDLGTLGGLDSWAVAVNASGQVAGSSAYTPGRDFPYHPFLWDGSSMRDLGTLGGVHAEAWGMNDHGHVVGHSEFASGLGNVHAFLWDGSEMHDLNMLIDPTERQYILLEVATDINNKGQIVAFGRDIRNTESRPHSFLLSPLEASAVVLSGYFQPVDPIPTRNKANAGRTIPLKFHVEHSDGTAIVDLESVDVRFAVSSCSALGTSVTDAVEQYSSGDRALINKGNGDYQFNWKTQKGLSGCGVVTLTLPGGYESEPSNLQAHFDFR